ncbi:hypothetical protein QRX50_14240 [Amycolatopsis carbonis]|uniref:Uncharacterized protein n=1 Tax=Amycolatopsis carbonis TaxID=715471 RepID=A0A9Y2INF3_9PSEU|nr:hypothetical protein [Amycolatopsis sp. 2-15]WIX81828.1 hypothetical protein QRX50_14240 [Amycolatopsis sp. 2-15]
MSFGFARFSFRCFCFARFDYFGGGSGFAFLTAGNVGFGCGSGFAFFTDFGNFTTGNLSLTRFDLGSFAFTCIGSRSFDRSSLDFGFPVCFNLGNVRFGRLGLGLVDRFGSGFLSRVLTAAKIVTSWTIVFRLGLRAQSSGLAAGLLSRGFLIEVVAATVHIVRLGFGRSLIASGVGVGSIAELPGDVPESAWHPHGPNPPRDHPVVSPMVAYVV